MKNGDVQRLGRQGTRIGAGYLVAKILVFASTEAGFPQLAEIEMEIGALLMMLGAIITNRWGEPAQ